MNDSQDDASWCRLHNLRTNVPRRSFRICNVSIGGMLVRLVLLELPVLSGGRFRLEVEGVVGDASGEDVRFMFCVFGD